jgi:hypothetical protein
MQRERDKAAKQVAKRERRAASHAQAKESASAAATPGDAASTDEQVLQFRRRGRSFSAIARDLGLARATDASDAFLRAVRTRPPDEEDDLRREEYDRLDRLTAQATSDASLDTAEVAKRLRTIERMRQLMTADGAPEPG